MTVSSALQQRPNLLSAIC